MHRALIILILFSCGPAGAAEKVLDFAEAPVEEAPRGFRSTLTGSGKPGEWKVILDDAPTALPALTPKAPSVSKRPVLAQLSRDRTDEHFPLLIYEEETFSDFTLSIRFKLVDGAEEQMAGIAFRLQDERNYYYIRASALGETFYFFKIVDGARSAPIGSKVKIEKGVWHELTLHCTGNQIRALLNGNEVIPPLTDTTFASGKIGFWTKSDAVSYFADTRITYTPRELPAQVMVREILRKYPRLQGLKIFAVDGTNAAPSLIASDDPYEVGRPGRKEEQDVIATNTIYHGKDKNTVTVTMPLRDSNGETVAAVKVLMKPFPGQTEKNAIARALPIVKQLQARIQKGADLVQ
jgi:hypothetical protein